MQPLSATKDLSTNQSAPARGSDDHWLETLSAGIDFTQEKRFETGREARLFVGKNGYPAQSRVHEVPESSVRISQLNRRNNLDRR